MRTVAWLKKELEKFPDDAECFAYEGELDGIVVRAGKKTGVIHCSEAADGDRKTETFRLPRNKKRTKQAGEK